MMNPDFNYTGKELPLFANAKNWKKYFSSFISKYIHGNTLEVGAGIGSNTLLLNNVSNATRWLLLDPDKNFSEKLKSLIEKKELPENCEVIQGTIFSLDNKIKFDTILYIDVLEHIQKDREELQYAIELLNIGGHLVLLSPAHNFLSSNFDKAIGHLRRYNKKSIRNVAEGLPLREIELIYLDSTGALLSLTNKILLNQKYPTSKQITLWDKYFVKISVLLDKFLFYRFGKTILAVWQKRVFLIE